MSHHNLKPLGKDKIANIPEDCAKKETRDEKIHPLELKYGKEPKIEPQEHWSWH